MKSLLNTRVNAMMLFSAFVCTSSLDAENVLWAREVEENPRLLEQRIYIGREEYIVRLSRVKSECVFTSDDGVDTPRSLINFELHMKKPGEANERLVWWNSTIDLDMGDSLKILGEPVFDVCGHELDGSRRLFLAIGNTYYPRFPI